MRTPSAVLAVAALAATLPPTASAGAALAAAAPPAATPARALPTARAAAVFADVPTRQAAQTAVVRIGDARATLRAGELVRAGAGRATVQLRGSVKLGGAILRDLRVTVGRTSSLSARVDGRRRTLITAGGGRRTVDAVTGVVRLRGARARPTADAAQLGATGRAQLQVDVDAGSDLAPGGMIDWGLSRELRAAAHAAIPAPAPAITVFDSAICATDPARDAGCEPDLATPRRRSSIHFPVIDGSRRSVEGQGGLKLGPLTLESPRLTLAGRHVTLRAFVTVDGTTVSQQELDVATFTTAAPLRRGHMLAWTTGPGTATPQAAPLLGATRLDPLTFSIDA